MMVNIQEYVSLRDFRGQKLSTFLSKIYMYFFIQFNVPFKIISLISRRANRLGAKREYAGKPPDTPASRIWLVSHVASAGPKL